MSIYSLKQTDSADTLFSSVFHLGAAIRVWERRSFTLKHSAAVNVDGTRNIIQAMHELPESSDKILLHCSSTSLVCAPPKLMRIFGNPCLRKDLHPLSDDKILPKHLWRKDNYARTKRIAEGLVREANGVQGLKTGAVSGPARLPLVRIPERSDQLIAATRRYMRSERHICCFR